MNSIIINKEGDYKDETISSVPLGINNITIENDDNFDLRRNNISSIKPMLSSSDGKRVLTDEEAIEVDNVKLKCKLCIVKY